MTYKSAIIWVAIAAILISAYFIATSFQFRVVFLFVGIPCVGFASIIVIFKLLLFLNKNRYIKHILKEAKSACGEPPASPVVENVTPKSEDTNLIRENVEEITEK